MRSLLDILEDITKVFDILIEASCAENDIELCDKIDSLEQELYDHAMKEKIKND